MHSGEFFKRFADRQEIGRDITDTHLSVFYDNGGEVGLWREERATTIGTGSVLAPRDADIRTNLNAVRDMSGLPPSGGSWFDRHAEFADPSTFFWLGCLGILITGTSELVRRLYSAHRLGLRAASFAGLALTLATLCNAMALWPVMSEAVVIVPATSVRLAPAILAEPMTSLREGELVSIDAERPEFALVRTAKGTTGWISRADLARVVPNSP